MNFKLIDRGRPSTGVHQGVTELEGGGGGERKEGKKCQLHFCLPSSVFKNTLRSGRVVVPGRTSSAGDLSLRAC